MNLQSQQATAQNIVNEQPQENVAALKQQLSFEQRSQLTYDTYILGPGDSLQVEVLIFRVEWDFLNRSRRQHVCAALTCLYVEGLTVEELNTFLSKQLSTYVRDPQIYIRPVAYRPIRVYVGVRSQDLVTTH